jgi:hypothetical protein
MPADPSSDPVQLSEAAIDQLDELPRSQARAVAQAIERIRDGAAGEQLKFSPAPNEPSYYAIRTPNADAPVVIYRPLTTAEGGGILVTALVSRKDFDAYRRADQKGLLDKPGGKAALSAAAAEAALGARGLSDRS